MSDSDKLKTIKFKVGPENSSHTPKQIPSGYALTIRGEVAVQGVEGKGNSIQAYTETVKVPSLDCALSVAKNKILPVLLAKKIPGYQGVITHEVIDAKPFGKAREPRGLAQMNYMNREQLSLLVEELGLSDKIDGDLYPTISGLRKMILLASESPDMFDKKLPKLLEDLQLSAELAELNPELGDSILDGATAA